MATEMVLVPKSTYDRWMSPPHDNHQKDVVSKKEREYGDQVKTQGNSDLDMDDSENNLSDTIEGEDGGDKEMASSSSSEKSDGSKSKEQSNFKDISFNILTKFPDEYKLYAKRLLSFIKKHGIGVLDWNEDDVLLYKGDTVTGSDISQLIIHLFKTNRAPPRGMKQFREGLNKIRVPKAFIKPYLLKPPGIPHNIKKKWLKY
jgi:hypothetical protein